MPRNVPTNGRRATPGPPSDNSLLGRKIPCSGNENSLFRCGGELPRKPFKLLRDLTFAIVKMARNYQNSLLNSLFSGNPQRRIPLRGAADVGSVEMYANDSRQRGFLTTEASDARAALETASAGFL